MDFLLTILAIFIIWILVIFTAIFISAVVILVKAVRLLFGKSSRSTQ